MGKASKFAAAETRVQETRSRGGHVCTLCRYLAGLDRVDREHLEQLLRAPVDDVQHSYVAAVIREAEAGEVALHRKVIANHRERHMASL